MPDNLHCVPFYDKSDLIGAEVHHHGLARCAAEDLAIRDWRENLGIYG